MNLNNDITKNDNSSERDSNIGLKNVSYDKPLLSDKVIKFDIPKYEELFQPTMPSHPFYQHHDKPFCKEKYLYSTIPLHIGEFKIKFIDSDIINVLRCPIKISGNRTIYLPDKLLFLKDFIEYCCVYENCFNKRFDELFAHITVDYKIIKAGDTQRVPGWHVDGFQGAKFPIKHEIEHSYLWASKGGTEFCVQPFFISHIDDSKYLIFDEMNKQANGPIFKCLDSNVYIIDPYMVHRSPLMLSNTPRLLVRLTFEYQKLLDPNDTQNPSLKFDIPYKYDIRNRLCKYNIPLNKEMYGFVNN
jgi:hypothetical protein